MINEDIIREIRSDSLLNCVRQIMGGTLRSESNDPRIPEQIQITGDKP